MTAWSDESNLVVVDERRDESGGSPRILVTNDDGIDSPGLRQLASALAADYDDVLVVAPAVDSSGSGTAIGRFEADLGVELDRVDFDGVVAYTVGGPPGLAVTAAALGAFGAPPDLVVSGVNAGINTGHSIIHSGTVGAALTSRTFGGRGLAVSLARSDPWHWDTAVAVTLAATRWLVSGSAPGSILNVNVPGLHLGDVLGARWAELDEFGHFRVAADMESRRLQLEIAGGSAGADPWSDTALCSAGFVTLTLLSPIEAHPSPDIDAGDVWEP